MLKDIDFRRISVNKNKMDILQNISGKFRLNRMTAVMGTSGCGKTTLLKTLSGRLNMKYDGNIYFHGNIVDKKILNDITAFVHQDDVLQSYSTVKESIEFASNIRGTNCDVLECLDSLGLLNVKDTIIGTPLKGGLSGGERKRLSIAMELIREPHILFLDEPTSGLDCLTALNLMNLLRQLSNSKTIVASIHQPSSDIFYSFDDLLVLKDGKVVYYGEVQKLVKFMAINEFICPSHINPADFLFTKFLPNYTFSEKDNSYVEFVAENEKMTLESTKNNKCSENFENDKKSLPKIHDFSNFELSKDDLLRTKKSEEFFPIEEKEFTKIKKKKRDSIHEFILLFSREICHLKRNKLIGAVKIAQSIFTAIVVGSIFYNINGKDYGTQIKNKCGVLYFLAVNLFFTSAFSSLQLFFLEYENLVREYQSGYFRFSSYFQSKIMINTIMTLLHPIILIPLLLYFLKIKYVFTDFMFLLIGSIFTSLTGQSIGFLTASVSPNMNVAAAILPSALLPLTLLNGMLVDTDNLFFIFKILQFISPTRHTFNIFVKCSFNNIILEDIMLKKLYDGFLSMTNSIFLLFILYLMNIILAFFFMRRKVIKAS